MDSLRITYKGGRVQVLSKIVRVEFQQGDGVSARFQIQWESGHITYVDAEHIVNLTVVELDK